VSRRNPPAKWVLPAVVDPPTSTCWKINVPDDRFHKAAFWGALLDLASAYKWQDDPAHTAKDVALVWRDVIENMVKCEPVVVMHGGIVEDFEMPIRVDCDCRVWVTCCDGTEVELATVGMIEKPGQPGPDSPPPPPGGACETYHATFDAKSQWLLPATVYAGDVLTFSNAKGAGWDGAFAGIWRCPSGQTFFAGACIGAPGPQGGDPASSQNHMQFVALIDGTYYPADTGVITVPGGVSNAQVVIQVNDSDLTDNSGSYSLDIELCNNSGDKFSHTFDFVVSEAGWEPVLDSGTPRATYNPGNGWDENPAYVPSRLSIYIPAFTPRQFTSLSLENSVALGGNLLFQSVYYGSEAGQDITAAGPHMEWGGSVGLVSTIRIDLSNDSNPNGRSMDGYVQSVTVTGLGTDPFVP